ncbi:MAG: YkgJ family cysteine cluster protein [Myxococcota bacterium]
MTAGSSDDERADALRGTLGALRRRVDDFFAAAERAGGLVCRRGCDACCRVGLTVGPLEADALRSALAALPPPTRAELAARSADAEVRAGQRCVFLGESGECTVYDDRPLVCRSQGLALSYALEAQADLPDVPLAALRGRAGEKGVVACPLNYGEGLPGGEYVLDADRVDEILAQLQLAWARLRALPPLRRVALRELAAGAPAIAGLDGDG